MLKEELQNKEQFLEEYDIRNVFQHRLKECGEAVEKTFPFLIVPKASKAEKNKGLEKFDEKETKTNGAVYRICKKCNKRAFAPVKLRCFCEVPDWEVMDTPKYNVKNNHPTVKPIKLMTYLITLATRPEDIVLDPFMGSGTTGIAAKMLNRQFVGIEMDKEYIKIAEARIEVTETLQKYIKNKLWEN